MVAHRSVRSVLVASVAALLLGACGEDVHIVAVRNETSDTLTVTRRFRTADTVEIEPGAAVMLEVAGGSQTTTLELSHGAWEGSETIEIEDGPFSIALVTVSEDGQGEITTARHRDEILMSRAATHYDDATAIYVVINQSDEALALHQDADEHLVERGKHVGVAVEEGSTENWTMESGGDSVHVQFTPPDSPDGKASGIIAEVELDGLDVIVRESPCELVPLPD